VDHWDAKAKHGCAFDVCPDSWLGE